jgi:hypothetical protein
MRKGVAGALLQIDQYDGKTTGTMSTNRVGQEPFFAQATMHMVPRVPLDSQSTGASSGTVIVAATTQMEPPPLAPDSQSDGTSSAGEDGRDTPWGADAGRSVARMVNMVIECRWVG